MRDIMPFYSSDLMNVRHEIDLLLRDRSDLTRVIIMDDATGAFLRADFYDKNEIGVDALYKTLYPQGNRFVVAVRHILHDNGNVTLFVAPGAVEVQNVYDDAGEAFNISSGTPDELAVLLSENIHETPDDGFQPLYPPGQTAPK